MSHKGLLLLNLGSPKSTAVGDVRRYLNQFLMDPYVIDLPWPLRRLLVGLIVLRRPAQSAAAYQEIWWPEGSPLVVNSQRLQQQVQTLWSDGPVALGMRYGEPSIERAVAELLAQGVDELVVAPLYPQYADSTTKTALEEVRRVLVQRAVRLKVRVLPAFYDDARYLSALVKSAGDSLAQPFDHLLLSFHGLPERYLQKIDPEKNHCLQSADCCERASAAVLATCYRAQCLRSARLFAQQAGLADGQWSVAFQSRLGRAKWIEPYTEEVLGELAGKGVKKLLVMSPAFVADCVETLEELGLRARETFIAAGGEDLQLVPCLNDSPDWAGKLVQMCQDSAMLVEL